LRHFSQAAYRCRFVCLLPVLDLVRKQTIAMALTYRLNRRSTVSRVTARPQILASPHAAPPPAGALSRVVRSLSSEASLPAELTERRGAWLSFFPDAVFNRERSLSRKSLPLAFFRFFFEREATNSGSFFFISPSSFFLHWAPPSLRSRKFLRVRSSRGGAFDSCNIEFYPHYPRSNSLFSARKSIFFFLPLSVSLRSTIPEGSIAQVPSVTCPQTVYRKWRELHQFCRIGRRIWCSPDAQCCLPSFLVFSFDLIRKDCANCCRLPRFPFSLVLGGS